MTTFELTWQYSLNNAYAPSTAADLGQYLHYWLKAFLTGQVSYKDNTGAALGSPSGLWTCYYSCNGTTAGTAGDGVDRFGSTYTPANIVHAYSPGTTHSWIVLYNAGLGVYMLIDGVNQNDNGGLHIECSKTAYTGGTTTTAPTSTNVFSTASSLPGGVQQLVTNSAVSHHFHGWLATNGECMMATSRDGSGFMNSMQMVRQLTETHTGDNHNIWYYEEFNDGSGVMLHNGPAGSSGATSATAIGWQGRSATPATAAVWASEGMLYVNGVSLNSDQPSVDPIDGKDQDAFVYLYAITAGHKSRRGRLQDVCHAPDALGVNKVEPSAGPPFASITIGNHFFPWQGMSVAASL